MADWYPTINGNNTKDWLEIINYSNNLTGGLLMPVVLLCIWIITFISTLSLGIGGGGAPRAWTFASFFTMILAIFSTLMNLLSVKYMYVSILLLGVGVVWIILSNSNE